MVISMGIIIYTDGASRGNPGKSASGYVIQDMHKKELKREVVYNGIKTNNYAEYNAIINALEWCYKNINIEKLEVKLFSDSQLVIKQINGQYKVKSKSMKELHEKVVKLVKHFKNIKFFNLSREESGICNVDNNLNKFLDSLKK